MIPRFLFLTCVPILFMLGCRSDYGAYSPYNYGSAAPQGYVNGGYAIPNNANAAYANGAYANGGYAAGVQQGSASRATGTYGGYGGYTAPAPGYQSPYYAPSVIVPPPATGSVGYGIGAPQAPYSYGAPASVPGNNGWQSVAPPLNNSGSLNPAIPAQPIARNLQVGNNLAWQSPNGSSVSLASHTVPVSPSYQGVAPASYQNAAPASSYQNISTANYQAAPTDSDCDCDQVAPATGTLVPQANPY